MHDPDAPAPIGRASLVGFGEALLVYKPTGPPASPDTCPMLQSVGGAELNSCVALARLGGEADGPTPRVTQVSVLPEGPLGDVVVRAGESAGVAMRALRTAGDIGTVHVVGSAPHYQRRNSVFAQLRPEALDWPSVLGGHDWLHLTGITPLVGEAPRRAWSDAIAHARALGVRVILDLNHRPSLGSFDELWRLVRAELPGIHTLVLSESALEILALMPAEEGGGALGAAPGGAAVEGGVQGGGASGSGKEAAAAHAAGAGARVRELLPTYASRYSLLSSLRSAWGVAMVVCCFKCAAAEHALHGGAGAVPLPASAAAQANAIKQGGNVRWAVVADRHGLCGSSELPTHHRPVQAMGGGDAWLAGFVSALARPSEAGRAGAGADAGAGLPQQAAEFSHARLSSACRRGDLLAALAQSTDGDFSHAQGSELAAAEARWRGRPAQLGASGAPAGGAAGGEAEGSAAELALQRREEEAAAVLGVGVLAVVTLQQAAHADGVVRALAAAGVRAIEIMLRTDAALHALDAACEAARALAAEGGPRVLVGAGTVLSEAQVGAAAAAGASFLVAPGLCAPVVRAARLAGLPMLPGVATPSEIEQAMRLGCRMLKLFPAATLGGPSALAALAAPYGSRIAFVPTGGVSAESMAAYLARPEVLAVGGSWLLKLDGSGAAARPDLPATEEAARVAVAQAAKVRPNGPRPLPPPIAPAQ